MTTQQWLEEILHHPINLVDLIPLELQSVGDTKGFLLD